MRSLHSVEEKLYSAELDLSPTEFKILLFIRHNTVRWEAEERPFGYGDIAKVVGVERRTAMAAIKRMKKKGLLLVKTSSKLGVHQVNMIGLNPKYFGEIIEPTCRPKFTVIPGGKVKKLSPQEPELSTEVSNQTPGVGSDSTPGVVFNSSPPTPPRPAPTAALPGAKEPSKEPIKELKELYSLLNTGNGTEIIKLRPIQCEDPYAEKERQLRLAREAGIL